MEQLRMEGICKAFNQIPVLEDVQLKVEKGEVHALLGENGAGKSTLMNILTGVYPGDAGKIWFEGKEVKNLSIRESEKLGIAFVHQELNLFNNLLVYENIFLGKEYTGHLGRLDKKRMRRETAELFEKLDVKIDPDKKVEELSASEKQLLEIAKALFFEARLLILDEPTTSLNNREVGYLFEMIRKLKKKGTSFIFISHKMPEIFKVADRYTVLVNGKSVETGNINETTPEELAKKMVGNHYQEKSRYHIRQCGNSIMRFHDYSGDGFQNVNLDIKQGEIIGLTGLQGAGSSKFLQSVFGVNGQGGGELYIHGEKVSVYSVHQAMKHKIAMVPSNRKENSVIPDMNVLENMYIAEHTLSAADYRISLKKEKESFEGYKKMLGIKVQDASYPITSLSGGNQQKIFLAKWLNTGAEIFLLDNPTQGIDIGAKEEIYKLIIKLSEEGKTILINTMEIPELQKIADRCAVFFEGKIVKILKHDEIREDTVMLYATGSGEEKRNDEKKKNMVTI